MSFINSISQAFVQELHRFVYVSVCSVLKVDFDICYLFCCRNQCLNRKIKPLIKFFVWYHYEGLCNLFTKKVSCGKTRVFPGFFFSQLCIDECMPPQSTLKNHGLEMLLGEILRNSCLFFKLYCIESIYLVRHL